MLSQVNFFLGNLSGNCVYSSLHNHQIFAFWQGTSMPNKEDPLCLLLQLRKNKCQTRWFLKLKNITSKHAFLSLINYFVEEIALFTSGERLLISIRTGFIAKQLIFLSHSPIISRSLRGLNYNWTNLLWKT